MGETFCVEYQRIHLKFLTKYLTHTLKDVQVIDKIKFTSSKIYELVSVFEMPPKPNISSWFDKEICQLNNQIKDKITSRLQGIFFYIGRI